jgi:hypothetical protein
MDTREIIDALATNDLDLARTKINQSLNERAVEAMKARKIEIGTSYFVPKAE